MRSLAWKLMLAFLIVGVSSVLLVSLLISLRTQSEFDRFLSARDQAVLEDALKDYYAQAGSWAGLEQSLTNRPPLNFYSRSIALADARRVIVLGNHGYDLGATLALDQISGGTSITVDNQIVGYMLLVSGKKLLQRFAVWSAARNRFLAADSLGHHYQCVDRRLAGRGAGRPIRADADPPGSRVDRRHQSDGERPTRSARQRPLAR